jgi:hypothetical protein
MRRKALALLLGLALLAPGPAPAHSSHGSHHSSTSSHKGTSGGHKNSTSSHRKSSSRCTTCPRDSHGKIKRSPEARQQFMKHTGYPHGRKGYVIDHIVPLACGGTDSPSNMQWQTKAAAKAKDKSERNGCKR